MPDLQVVDELYQKNALKPISKLYSAVMSHLVLGDFNTFKSFLPFGFVLHTLLLSNSSEPFGILYNGPKSVLKFNAFPRDTVLVKKKHQHNISFV